MNNFTQRSSRLDKQTIRRSKVAIATFANVYIDENQHTYPINPEAALLPTLWMSRSKASFASWHIFCIHCNVIWAMQKHTKSYLLSIRAYPWRHLHPTGRINNTDYYSVSKKRHRVFVFALSSVLGLCWFVPHCAAVLPKYAGMGPSELATFDGLFTAVTTFVGTAPAFSSLLGTHSFVQETLVSRWSSSSFRFVSRDSFQPFLFLFLRSYLSI